MSILARYASRFSVRALDLTVDSSMLWVGAVLAIIARYSWRLFRACRLRSRRKASVLPAAACASPAAPAAACASSPSPRLPHRSCCSPARACSSRRLLSLQSAQTGFDMHRVLALNVPVMSLRKIFRRDHQLSTGKPCAASTSCPGVDHVALGTTTPWRDAGSFGPGFAFSGEGHVKGSERRRSARAVSVLFRRDFSLR